MTAWDSDDRARPHPEGPAMSSSLAESSQASTLRYLRLLGLDDFEGWRQRVMGLLSLGARVTWFRRI